MKAWELIETSGWTQHTNARSASGGHVSYLSKDAVAFCIMGALCRVYDPDQLAIQAAADRARDHLGLRWPDSASVWNDDPKRTKAEVVALLRELDI